MERAGPRRLRGVQVRVPARVGTLYRTLQRMRVEGLIEEIGVNAVAVAADRRAERRRSYRITPAGRATAREEARRLAAMLASDAAQRLLQRGPRRMAK